MAKPRVLITGENGFVGSHLMRLHQQFEVIPSGVDLLKWNDLSARILAVNPEVILHLAGISLPAQCDQDPTLAYEVNVAGTALLLEAMLKAKSRARLIFASTAQVYEPLKKGAEVAIAETHPIAPINLYARTKRMAEKVIEEFCAKYEMKATVLRLFNHVHYSQKGGTFLSSMYQEILRKKEESKSIVIPVGNIDLYRDMGSISDLMGALSAAVLSSDRLGDFVVFNICNSRARHLAELARLLAEQLKVSATFQVDASRIRENDPYTIVGSHERFTAATGWRPQVKEDAELIEAFLQKA